MEKRIYEASLPDAGLASGNLFRRSTRNNCWDVDIILPLVLRLPMSSPSAPESDQNPSNSISQDLRKKRELAAILAISLCLAAIVSWLVAWWLHIPIRPQQEATPKPATHNGNLVVAGSSLIYYGIDWNRAADSLNLGLHTFAAPAASPAELEQTPFHKTPSAIRVLGISIFEMTEAHISDARASMVPITQSIGDLQESDLPWALRKRILSAYPTEQFRLIYPTFARSIHVMVGLRSKAMKILGRETESRATITDNELQNERLSDWDPGRCLRNLESMRASVREGQFFSGPKYRALNRMVSSADPSDRTLVLVMPVSSVYRREIAGESGQTAFEESLQELPFNNKNVRVLRLDRAPSLDDDSLFCDLVHLNKEGQIIASDLAIRELRTLGR